MRKGEGGFGWWGREEGRRDGPVTMATLPLRRLVGVDEVVAILVAGLLGEGVVVLVVARGLWVVIRDSWLCPGAKVQYSERQGGQGGSITVKVKVNAD